MIKYYDLHFIYMKFYEMYGIKGSSDNMEYIENEWVKLC